MRRRRLLTDWPRSKLLPATGPSYPARRHRCTRCSDLFVRCRELLSNNAGPYTRWHPPSIEELECAVGIGTSPHIDVRYSANCRAAWLRVQIVTVTASAAYAGLHTSFSTPRDDLGHFRC